MKTEQILPTTGAFMFGVIAGIVLFAVLLLPHYTKAINHAHWADEVIEECIDQYPDFYDVVAEGDSWGNYVINK